MVAGIGQHVLPLERATMRTPRLATTTLVLATIAMGQAMGQTAATQTAPARAAGTSLTIPELTERLTQDGYKDVSETKRKGERLYKVSARDPQGRSMELTVDARTAEILASEAEDDD
jgi:hypothetical protein